MEEQNISELAMELQIAKAKKMGVEERTLGLLKRMGGQKDWQRLEWFYLCSVDRMPFKELEDMEKRNFTVLQIRQKRQEHLKKICASLEPVYESVKEMQKEVRSVCEESRRTKRVLEENIDKALEQQYLAQSEAIKAKDDNITFLKEQVKELKNLNAELKRQNAMHKGSVLPDSASGTGKRELSVPDVPVLVRSDAKKGEKMRKRKFFSFTKDRQKKSENGIQQFINAYIKNDDYSEKQKEFFLDCMEEGMSAAEIAVFASQHLSVPIMKRLKEMQVENGCRKTEED